MLLIFLSFFFVEINIIGRHWYAFHIVYTILSSYHCLKIKHVVPFPPCRSLLSRGSLSYKESGVDIIAGNNLIKGIKPAVNMTTRKGVIGDIGDFGALFDLKAAQYKEPVLVSGTDGVGTKVKVRHSNCSNIYTQYVYSTIF